MKATGLVLAVGAFLMSLVACSTRAAQGQEPADELAVLRAENDMLKRQRTGYLKYVENQAQEILRLKALLKEAGIDPEQKADGEPAPVDEKEVPPPAGGFAAAIRRHLEEAKAVAESQDTDIQKRTAWLQAARRFNDALGQETFLIEYEVEEVQFEAGTNTARLTFSSAKVEDWKFHWFYGMRIFAEEKTALSIKRGSRATLRGLATLNVDFSKPTSEQPAFFNLPSAQEIAQSYRPAACVSTYVPSGERLPWHLSEGRILLLVRRRDCLVEIDGVRHALREVEEVEVDPREEKTRRPPPPPPVIRVEPRIVRPAR